MRPSRDDVARWRVLAEAAQTSKFDYRVLAQLAPAAVPEMVDMLERWAVVLEGICKHCGDPWCNYGDTDGSIRRGCHIDAALRQWRGEEEGDHAQ